MKVTPVASRCCMTNHATHVCKLPKIGILILHTVRCGIECTTPLSHNTEKPQQWHTKEFFFRVGGSTNSVEDRGQREQESGSGSPLVSQGFHSIWKWVKPILLLGCYRCIFHGTGNLARLCQNFRILGGGVFEPPLPPWYTSERKCVI
jgi:hypothetical protein